MNLQLSSVPGRGPPWSSRFGVAAITFSQSSSTYSPPGTTSAARSGRVRWMRAMSVSPKNGSRWCSP
jgi:hypothetical protein